MKNLTPENMRCAIGTCPGVYELADRRLLIVGKAALIEAMAHSINVGGGEEAIIIDRALLSEVLRDKPTL